MKYKFFRKIFKIPFPFTDLSSQKSRPALAVSEPDDLNDIEFLFITTKETRGFDRVIPIKSLDYAEKELPYESIVHVGKPYLLNASIIGKYLCEMTDEFMERVLRELNYRETSRFYEFFHLPKQNMSFNPGETSINYAGRVYDEKEMINLVDSALDFWLTAGPYSRKVERKMCELFGAKKFYLVNSGSSANLIMISALKSLHYEGRLNPRDEIITPSVTFPTTLTPIVQNQLIPVFVDCEIGTYNIDSSLIEDAISSRTKAILVPHTLGNPCKMDVIMDIAKRKDLIVLEDCCDALGSTYNGKLVGTFGSMASLSFYPAHHMTMGEGGGVVINDPALANIALSIRDWGRDCWCEPGHNNSCGQRFSGQFGDLPFGYDHKYVYSNLGYNLKVTDMQAAIGLAQFEKLEQFTEARRNNFNYYYEHLKSFEDKLILPRWEEESNPSWFGFPITVREGIDINDLIRHFEDAKIETRKVFAGNILKQPGFKEIEHRVYGSLRNTDTVMERTFFIGVYPGLTSEMREFIVEKFEAFLRS